MDSTLIKRILFIQAFAPFNNVRHYIHDHYTMPRMRKRENKNIF